ncbi:MAG: DNA polymerase III subunit delta' [Rhodocyclaceae bacterium]|nr:DNA polymerase III subunit delta' [Rhodocyclaceae bacterium]
MSVNKYLSWHGNEWRQLWDAPAGLPHALLLAGPAGVGKSHFAAALVQRILCEAPRQAADCACGECTSCRLFAAGNHPDFRHVIPEAEALEAEGEGAADAADKKKASSQILIGQIRALESFVYIGGHLSNRRVILLEPAEAMNPSAENSLLKILEEPPAGVCFVLVSDRWRRLLPTIRSRCRTLMFGRPGAAEARQWLAAQGGEKALPLLAMTGGAPIRALDEFEKGRMKAFEDVASSLFDNGGDFLALAGRWESHLKKDGGFKMEDIVAMVQKGLFDLAFLAMTGRLRFFEGRERQAEAIAARADAGNILGYYGELLRARALASHPLNPRLFLDDIAARYLRAIAPARP